MTGGPIEPTEILEEAYAERLAELKTRYGEATTRRERRRIRREVRRLRRCHVFNRRIVSW